VVREAAPAAQTRAAGSSLDPAELEKFLINFVVEQTGYPPEVVELDADLEADLGIDSIKKAQLFGELAEYFDVQPTENMTLDDFPTLRHVMNFLVGGDLKKNLVPKPFDEKEPAELAADGAEFSVSGNGGARVAQLIEAAAAVTEHQATAGDRLKVMRLAGTPYQMGLEHGQKKKAEIRRILRRYVDLAGPEIDDLPFQVGSTDDLAKYFTPDELDELQGIAESVQVPLTSILVHNLAIFSDFGAVSLHFAVAAAHNPANTLIHASSEQLPLSSVLGDCLDPVVQVRCPTNGIAHVVLSVAGAIGGLSGVNACGLAVTAGALHNPADGQPALRGRMHAAIASHLLSHAVCMDSAIELLKRYRNGAAWNVCLSHHPTDRVCHIESDGRALHVRDSADAVIATNRSALHAPAQVPAELRHRWNELEKFLAAEGTAGFTADHIRSLWSNRAAETNGKAATNGDAHANHSLVRRVDVIIDPSRGDFWVNPASPANGKSNGYYRFSLRELLPASHKPPAQIIEASPGLSPKYDLDDNAEETTHRFATTMVDFPLDASVPAMPTWQGAALIVGKNPLGDALRKLLEGAGVVVRELPIADDLDETLAAFERIWNEQPTPHVFIVTGRDADIADPNDEAAWKRRWYRVALLPYFLGQRWVQLAGQANILRQCTFVGATALNGDFGFSGKIDSPECAALTGLLKAIYVEVAVLRKQTGMRATAVDAPDSEPPTSLAASICRELASNTVDYAVAYVQGNRRLEYAFPEQATPEQYVDIRAGGTWVFTGGARGITAECALELGRRFGLKLHLIGTSPLQPIDPLWRNLSAAESKSLKTTVMRDARAAGRNMDEEWSRVQKNIEIDRSLRAFAEAGVEATYHACDVADRDALSAVLQTIRRISGPIEGIVHGAGIERASTYERKQRDLVMATLAAKVDGALNLMRLTRQDPIRWFIGFGSVSGRMGSNGQTDYCLASDVLCKLAGWYRTQRPGVRSVGFHWHPWDEVGMAARPETITMLRMTDGPSRMSKQEGIKHLLREMYAGTPISEVLVTTWDYHGRFYGTDDHPKPSADRDPELSPADVAGTPAEAKPAAPPAVGTASSNTTKSPAAIWEKLPFEPLTSRHELRMVAAGLPPGTPDVPQWQGSACILGHNPTALALRDRLLAQGVAVHMLPDTTSPDEAMAAMDAIYASQPIRYLFLMSGRDESRAALLDQAGWQQRRAAGVVVPFMGAQQWFRLRMKAKDTTPITVVGVTSLGGDFGLSQKVAVPEGGAICGMLKSVYVEDTRKSPSEVRVKVIDSPADEAPSSVVDSIFRELASTDPNVEVGWSRDQRSVVRSFARPVESLPQGPVPHGGTWVVTGGARGVTAAAAFELGARFGMKLHLIGRSPAPREDVPWRACTPEKLSEIKSQVVRQAVAAGRSPEAEWDRIKADIEIHDTLRKFANAGIQATYHSCDLSNWDQLATILDEVRRQDGPIEGIVHGAGFARSGRFGTRSRELLERTLAGKLDGAVGLMSLTRQDPVRYFIGFGSISGRYGGNGLSEYATANDMLAKLFDWYRAERPDCATCCIHWQSWDEIGMAMLGDSAVGTKGILKMAFIPPKEGVEHLCRELQAGLPSSEVLIGDGFFERTFYPFATPADATVSNPNGPSRVEIGRLPLVEKIQSVAAGGIEAEIHFEPTSDPFLFDHKLRGKPLLPAVIGLEAVAEAAALYSGKTVVAIRDVQLIEGFLCHTDQTMVARIRVAAAKGNALGCKLLSDFRNRAGKLMKKDRCHLRATAEVADRPVALDFRMPEPPTAWHPVVFQNDGPLYHGPTLHGLQAATFDAKGGWGQLVALPLSQLGGTRAGRDWIVPATLVDAGFYVCGIHCWFNNQEAFSLPSSVEAVRLGRMPRDNEKCLVAFECREIQSQHAIYDFTVFGEDRSVIVRVDGHRIVMIK
jgi:NAD(P)-dependent dehydrogenase (short-subunit alcohol dehydrogenase family)/acyl carrier protein